VLAREVAAHGGDVLEVGFGMGISAHEIMKVGCRTYSVIEAHPEIASYARQWGEMQGCPVNVLEGFWQDLVPCLDRQFDGILFDTFPVCQEDAHTNPAAMIADMAGLLKPGGILTYYSGADTNYPRDQIHLLLQLFAEVKLIKVNGLLPYPAPRCDYWNKDYMVLPVARKQL
jgi:guanidinoacetate N-methyltransferase